MEFLFLLGALGAGRLQPFGELLNFPLFTREELIGAGDQRICFLELGGLLASLRFGGRDVSFVARDQFAQLLGPLPIEFDPVSEPGQFALQPLHFGPRIPDRAIDLIQASPFAGQLVFVRLNPGVGGFSASSSRATSARPRSASASNASSTPRE